MDNDEKIKTLQNYEYKLQQILTQKQQMQGNLMELNNAISELEKNNEAYEIVGPIMIKKSSSEITKGLTEKKSLVDIKLKSIDKQEKMIQEKAQELQHEVLNEMQKTNANKKGRDNVQTSK